MFPQGRNSCNTWPPTKILPKELIFFFITANSSVNTIMANVFLGSSASEHVKLFIKEQDPSCKWTIFLLEWLYLQPLGDINHYSFLHVVHRRGRNQRGVKDKDAQKYKKIRHKIHFPFWFLFQLFWSPVYFLNLNSLRRLNIIVNYYKSSFFLKVIQIYLKS